MKKISVIGSTGSIGVNTLRVVRAHGTKLKVVSLAAKRSAELLFRQAKEFQPKVVCLYEEQRANWLTEKLKPYRIRVVTGLQGLIEVSTLSGVDQVIFATVGAVGLSPLFSAVKLGRSVAIANKEPLVMAGELLRKVAAHTGSQIVPIDSEHSGLWQCIEGRAPQSIKKLVLTSSGGPFFRKQIDLRRVTPEQALKHPKWQMGRKITIDSATLMNKGLEVIEAKNLFDVSTDQIQVLVHPEAVVHGIIEFVDGSQLAQLGITDMRLPIQYALSYPNRFQNTLPTLDLTTTEPFHFFKPDIRRFPCLRLGFEAARIGKTMPAVVNAANEVVVEAFLNRLLCFHKIPKLIERVMKQHRPKATTELNTILEADLWARDKVRSYV